MPGHELQFVKDMCKARDANVTFISVIDIEGKSTCFSNGDDVVRQVRMLHYALGKILDKFGEKI